MLEWSDVQFMDGPKLRLVAGEKALRAIDLRCDLAVEGERNDSNAVIGETARQLTAYFAGDLREFELPLDLRGTAFQLKVWRELERIPYGETRSYTQIAVAIGTPQAVRAVGAANGANPIPIVVPCHRVIGASGKLVGYGGGLPLKQLLLALEGTTSGRLAL